MSRYTPPNLLSERTGEQTDQRRPTYERIEPEVIVT